MRDIDTADNPKYFLFDFLMKFCWKLNELKMYD